MKEKESEAFLQRLDIELRDLIDKINKLNCFMNTDKFKKLDDTNRILLLLQKRTMDDYCDILNERIKYISDNQCN